MKRTGLRLAIAGTCLAAASLGGTACRDGGSVPAPTGSTPAGATAPSGLDRAATHAFTRAAAGPVLANHPDGAARSFIGDPAVLFHDGRFWMFFPSAWQLDPDRIPAGTRPDEIAMPLALATSPDGEHWTTHDRGTPRDRSDDYVLQRDSRSSWDSATLETPTVLYDTAAGKFRMWFAGSSQGRGEDEGQRFLTFRIGYAESRDGVAWEKHDDPSSRDEARAESDWVLGPRDGRWPDLFVSDPTVLLEEGRFRMWFTGAGRDMVAIGYAESRDGTHWEMRDEPVLPPDAAEGYTNGPAVLRTEQGYEMWYYARDVKGILHATSTDGISWAKDGVVLPLGEDGRWDDSETSSPTVTIANGQYWLYYTGTNCPMAAEDRLPGRAACDPHIAVGLATRPVAGNSP